MTNNHNQSWFVGYTPQRAASVWIGNVKPAKANGELLTLNPAAITFDTLSRPWLGAAANAR